jgi:hypothetical protein
MYIAYLTLLSGLFLSLMSEYFSILGLMTIFSASPITIAVMGVSLGIGKIVSTLWLKQNWTIAPLIIKIYLLSAIAVLMVITSLGCFGLLSKAHMDQGVPTGDVAAQVAILEEKIKIEKDNIDANKQVIKQLDAQVDQVLSRSDTETGAIRSATLRRSQQKERASLLADIQSAQVRAAKLAEEKAPISSQLRKVEAEVGPIKYIAAFFYGETNPTVLEKAVTWVIILLIIVFDPLAVILLLASQYSFQSFRLREAKEDIIPVVNVEMAEPKVIFPTPPDKEPAYEGVIAQEASSLFPEAVVSEEVVPITVEDIMEDPGIKAFFENGKEVARRLDAGESLEGLPNVTIVEETEPLPDIDTLPTPIEESDFIDSEHVELEEELIPYEEQVDPPDIKEIQEDARYDVKYYDWSKVPDGQEYVVIDGQKMHIRAAKALYKQTPSVYLNIIKEH